MSEKKKDKFHRITQKEINALPGREMKSRRTRSSKTYSLGNGLYQAVIYPEAIHYRNEKGEWEDIDHTLTQENGAFCDHSGDLAVTLAPGGCVTLKKNHHSLSWEIRGAAPAEAVPENASTKFPRHDKNLRTENKVTYSNIFPDVDFVCDLKPNQFKDTLIFKKPEALRPAEFLIRAENLVLRQTASGAVVAMCGDDTIFRLPAPCVVDEYGDAVPGSANATLTQISDCEWCWTCEVSADYAANAFYPLYLDPVVETERTSAAMSMAYTSSKRPTTNYSGKGTTLIADDDYSLGKVCTFLRFNNDELPLIDTSYYVTAATLTMAATYDNDRTAVYLKEVLSAWEEDEITYDVQPLVSDEPLEFDFSPSADGHTMEFNIANLVRKWYNEVNYGIRLETTAGDMIRLGGATSAYRKPYLTINYVSLAGLESYLQQDSISCGRAGTAYIGLFNGNLVFGHQETSMNGNLMPVSIGRFYNSCYHDVNAFHAGNGWKFSTQRTLHKEVIDSTTYYVYMDGDGTRHHFKEENDEWKDLSGLQLTMEIEDNIATIIDKGDNKMIFPLPTNEFLVDGSENYSNVTWITSASNPCGIEAEFAHTKPADAESNEFTIAKDGANRLTTAAVDSNLMITQIKAPGMNPVQYEYQTTGQLSKITHPDGAVTTYGYNESGLLETITNCDNSGIRICYHDGITKRVNEIHMFDTNQNVYAIRRYEYGNCCTTVNELYPDGTNEDGSPKYGEGKPLHYHFNDAGNLVSVNDELGYGYFAGYSDSAPANHPDYSSKLQRSVNNYLINHHFINVDDSWTVEKKDGGTGDCSYSSDNNYVGGRAYKLEKTNTEGQIGIYQTITLKDGADYTFSCQYMTQDDGEVQLQVAFPGVAQRETSPALRATSRWNRTHVTFTVPKNSAETETTYTDVSVYITAVNGIGTVWADAAQVEDGKVPNRYNLLVNGNFYMNDSGRPLYWSAGDNNTDNDGVTTDIQPGRPKELTGNVARLYGQPGVEKALAQIVPSYLPAGTTLVAGGWAWSNCRPRNDSNSCPFEMEILGRAHKDDYRDPDTGEPLSGTTVPFETIGRVRWSEEWSGWQFAAVPIVLKCRYTQFRVKLVYRNNLNEAQFSNLFFHKEEFGQSYAYDDNGNVTSVKNLASLQSNSKYDDYDNLISYSQPGRSEKYRLDWGDNEAEQELHLLRKTTSPLNIVQRTIYDTRTPTTENSSTTLGLPEKTYTEATFVNDNGNTCRRFIAAETGYTPDKNYASTSTDARKKVVTTVTDPNRGVVTSVTDPKGQTVAYKHDDLNRTTMVYTGSGSKAYLNQYVYENDLLKEVRHNTAGDAIADLDKVDRVTREDDVVYTFEYDSKNRRTGVKVGNQYLSRDEYDDTPGPQYGVLARSIFYNSTEDPQVVHYTYDDFKRMTSIRYGAESENKRYSFEYDANGQVARITNHELERVVLSEHDASNRPMRITHMKGDDHVYTGEVTYDEYNNLERFEEEVGTEKTAYSTAFTYDEENKPTLLKYNDSVTDKVAYTYDELGRTAKRTVTVNGRAYETSYAYIAGEQTYTPEETDDDTPTYATTGLIASITQTGGNFTYTYDDNGNITRVIQDGVTTEYTYDALGQLIQVDDGQENATWVYEYDQGGNILSKKKYALGVTSGTAADEMVFGYVHEGTSLDDEQERENKWRDLLKYVNGKRIYYDMIGNPLQVGENNDVDKVTYTWEKGRQLASMSKPGETVEFKYNENGLRIKKVATSTGTTNYTLHGKNIVHMTRDKGQQHDDLHFFYDASNKPAIVEFNGTKYAYVHNLQGDIVAILDSDGTAVVNYKYDAWGRQIDCTFETGNNEAEALSTLNPFRYRGYVYDEETGLYYLRTRYYSPTISRFISPDRYVYTAQGITSCDMYVYCCNMPVTYSDDSGQFLFTAIGALVGGVIGAIDAGIKGEDIWEGAKDGAKTGAVAGAGFDVAGVALLATGGSPAGIIIAGAAVSTSGALAYGMATDSTMVIDVSVVTPPVFGFYYKAGVSLVVDFSENEVNAYGHHGLGFGNCVGLTYSVGKVTNYENAADYKEHFADMSIGYGVGIDHCWNPLQNHSDSTQATCLTFSYPPSFSWGVGWDYFLEPICIGK